MADRFTAITMSILCSALSVIMILIWQLVECRFLVNTAFQAGVVGERSTLAVLTAFRLLAARTSPQGWASYAYPARALSHCKAKRATSREFFKSSLSLMCDRWVS